MNFLDILLAIPLCIFLWKGYKKGVIYEISALAGLICGTYAAIHFSCYVAKMLDIEGETTILVAFFITFVGVVILAFLCGKIIQGFVKLVKVGFLNNLLGAIFCMLQCVCILSVLLYYISVIDHKETLLTKDVKTESVLYKPINRTGNHLIGTLKTYVANQRESR